MSTCRLRLNMRVMSWVYFTIALILIFEVSFRLWSQPQNAPHYYFYPFNHEETNTIRWHVYHIFEHTKAILFSVALTIVFTRCSFLIWMFSIDLISYLLYYYSTWTYFYGIPLGVDTIKLVIFGGVIIREALAYHYGHHPDTDERRNFISYAHGHVPKTIRAISLRGFLQRLNFTRKNP